MGGGGGAIRSYCGLNGINANHINVLMFLAERPGCCCVQKAQSQAVMHRFAALLLLVHTKNSGNE